MSPDVSRFDRSRSQSVPTFSDSLKSGMTTLSNPGWVRRRGWAKWGERFTTTSMSGFCGFFPGAITIAEPWDDDSWFP